MVPLHVLPPFSHVQRLPCISAWCWPPCDGRTYLFVDKEECLSAKKCPPNEKRHRGENSGNPRAAPTTWQVGLNLSASTPTRSVDHTYTNFVRCSPLHQQGPLDSCLLHSAMATVEKTVGVPAPVQSTVIVPPQATRQHPPNEKACCCCPVLHGTSSHVKKVGR